MHTRIIELYPESHRIEILTARVAERGSVASLCVWIRRWIQSYHVQPVYQAWLAREFCLVLDQIDVMALLGSSAKVPNGPAGPKREQYS